MVDKPDQLAHLLARSGCYCSRIDSPQRQVGGTDQEHQEPHLLKKINKSNAANHTLSVIFCFLLFAGIDPFQLFGHENIFQAECFRGRLEKKLGF